MPLLLPGLRAHLNRPEYQCRSLMPLVAWICMMTLVVQRQPTFGQPIMSDDEMRARTVAMLADMELLSLSREAPSVPPLFDESEEVPLV